MKLLYLMRSKEIYGLIIYHDDEYTGVYLDNELVKVPILKIKNPNNIHKKTNYLIIINETLLMRSTCPMRQLSWRNTNEVEFNNINNKIRKKMYYTELKKFPSAHVTTGKQRLKQNGSNVYLNDGEEFEIEIFNPKSISVLAKIKINGNYLSGGGIIVRPGQRVFLERYLNETKKFKFKVYEVNSSSKEVQEAIKNNGEVIVEFYDENVYLKNPIMTLAGINSTWNNRPFLFRHQYQLINLENKNGLKKYFKEY